MVSIYRGLQNYEKKQCRRKIQAIYIDYKQEGIVLIK